MKYSFQIYIICGSAKAEWDFIRDGEELSDLGIPAKIISPRPVKYYGFLAIQEGKNA
jgi:hypothetical protein